MSDFGKAIEEAQQGVSGTLESPFGEPSSRGYAVKEAPDLNEATGNKIKVYPYTYHHDVFVVYRPWNECPRCWSSFKQEQLHLPEDGDYTCLHTRRAAYLELMQKFYKEGYLRISYKEETLKSGVIQAAIAWAVPEKQTEVKRRAPSRL